ncbi:hypothetical protein [Bradyrhizobium symbiodeficiens]|uniref:hypothetical protein n=1 Tax=Bradyrhizobium symbiodeficiens TaxID=1404367 RepID=UPI0012D767CC|nr:hypothetical protein [Bradyrhizobium symbiodeficiens]
MASTFPIVMSIWLGTNIVFLAVQLWSTGPQNWGIDACSPKLSTVFVKSRQRRHA